MNVAETSPTKKGSKPRNVQPLSVVDGDGLLQRETVCAYTGFGETHLYAAIKTKGFPAPVKLSPRCVRWHAPAVRAWVAKQVAGVAA
jgi:predicted DNA-binding transcriptional regulator AlpA